MVALDDQKDPVKELERMLKELRAYLQDLANRKRGADVGTELTKSIELMTERILKELRDYFQELARGDWSPAKELTTELTESMELIGRIFSDVHSNRDVNTLPGGQETLPEWFCRLQALAPGTSYAEGVARIRRQLKG